MDDTAQKAKKARGETDLKWDLKWSEAGKPDKSGIHPLILLSSETLEGATKIVGFDIDWTVIQTSSGRKFATGRLRICSVSVLYVDPLSCLQSVAPPPCHPPLTSQLCVTS